jgi:hypothetical protein
MALLLELEDLENSHSILAKRRHWHTASHAHSTMLDPELFLMVCSNLVPPLSGGLQVSSVEGITRS